MLVKIISKIKVIFLIFFLCLFQIAFAKVKVLFIISYTLKEKPTKDQYKGTLDALRYYGFKIQKKVIQLNYRYASKEELNKKINKTLKIIKKYKPKLIYIYDDPAFSYFLPYLKGKNFYVIFSGINKDINIYNRKYTIFDKNGYPLSNIVGVIEPLFINELITTALYAFGDAKKYPFLVSNDITGQSVLSEALLYLKNNPYYLKKTSIYTFSNLDSYIAFLQDLNKNDNNKFIIEGAFKLKKNNNTYVGIFDILKLTTKYYLKPILGFADSWVKRGATLGVSCDFYDMGYEAGKLGAHLLQGYPLFFFKIKKENKRKLIINTRSFQNLNKKLPLGMILASDKIY